MERFRNKNILIVGIGKTGFRLINFFNRLDCNIRVTDIKPIFDLNKAVKKLRKIKPAVEMTFGEHLDDDFINADVVVYSGSVDPNMPQLELARREGKEVYSEFALGNKLCRKPIIAVCGSHGRTTVAHMIGFTLRQDGKNVFVGGTSESPFIEYSMLPNKDEIDYVVVEVSAVQMRRLTDFHPKMVVFTDIADTYPQGQFTSMGEYMETKLSIIKTLSPDDTLIVNFDKLANNSFFRNANCQTYWYSRRSFVKLGVMEEIQGTHFHDRRIHSNINYHSEFVVKKMRIIGQNNRENLLAAITACKALDLSDEAIQTCVTKFPGIPHRI
ncbi:Mur ligase family protein, partial [Halobacteriovorax sp. ZH3_bin.1]